MNETAATEQGIETRRRKAEGMLLATTLIWGTTFGSTKELLETMQPMGLLTWRFGVAALVFILLFFRKLSGIFTGDVVVTGSILGLLLYLGFGLQTAGLTVTSSSRSGFITALYVLFTPILQTLITKKPPTKRVLVSVAIVTLGLWGLTSEGDNLFAMFDTTASGGFNIGDLMTLASAFSFAIYIIYLDRIGSKYSTIHLTAVQLSVVAILCAVHRFVAEPWTHPASAADWGLIFFLALFATVASTYWQTQYQHQTTPSRAAVIFTMESVFAALIGIFLLGETLGVWGVAGGVLIISGLLLVELGGNNAGNENDA